MKTTATVLLSLCLTLAVQAEIRIWKDASGAHEIKAELVGVQGGKVTLKRENGTTITLPVTSLSKADQALLGGGSGGSGAAAGDWPQWRGPNRDDVSKETGLLKKWPSDGPKRVWVNEDAGLGYSGFAIAGGKLYTMGLYDAEEKVVCLDAATGKKVWDSPVGAIYKNKWGDGPRCTPTVAGGKVYAIGGNGDLVCLDAATGKQDWTKSLTKDLGGALQNWGYTESPLVDGDLVIVTPGGSKGAIAALSTKTGKVEWQTNDVTENAQYSSIIPIDHGGQRQYVQLLMKTILGVSKDGKVLWKSDFPGATAVIPTPIYNDGQIYVAAGYGVGCKAVKLGSGSVEEVYSNKNMVNHHGGVILIDGLLYGHSDGRPGGWTCQDFKTGEVVWQDQGIGKGAVTSADGMLYCQAERDGTIALVEVSKSGWKLVSSFKLEAQSSQRSPDGRIWTHPVVAGGKLYLRDQEFISCYDVKG
ncbi:PQQ-binding-like beta-propeller repeat protein [Prosthecobacter sp.]|uniref:outer membrane protein assembly factor BamB family protein n=1 Tax=Prosthecobacter sp. TaxID=1965333 RepID=UPI002AB90384|nr:PQQ-binding-like beta-propeller repeat protein [Prosthecobacter sp.]MDZ4405106.1 PQQ-binding-like beta-propeller repeat protein [Prosthecobacter sp.]